MALMTPQTSSVIKMIWAVFMAISVPVTQKTPWPIVPSQLEGKVLNDWLKARFLVNKTGEATVVILQPATNHELTQVSLQALKEWTFLPQMDGDHPVDGEVSIRIHFRTQ